MRPEERIALVCSGLEQTGVTHFPVKRESWPPERHAVGNAPIAFDPNMEATTRKVTGERDDSRRHVRDLRPWGERARREPIASLTSRAGS